MTQRLLDLRFFIRNTPATSWLENFAAIKNLSVGGFFIAADAAIT